MSAATTTHSDCVPTGISMSCSHLCMHLLCCVWWGLTHVRTHKATHSEWFAMQPQTAPKYKEELNKKNSFKSNHHQPGTLSWFCYKCIELNKLPFSRRRERSVIIIISIISKSYKRFSFFCFFFLIMCNVVRAVRWGQRALFVNAVAWSQGRCIDSFMFCVVKPWYNSYAFLRTWTIDFFQLICNIRIRIRIYFIQIHNSAMHNPNQAELFSLSVWIVWNLKPPISCLKIPAGTSLWIATPFSHTYSKSIKAVSVHQFGGNRLSSNPVCFTTCRSAHLHFRNEMSERKH